MKKNFKFQISNFKINPSLNSPLDEGENPPRRKRGLESGQVVLVVMLVSAVVLSLGLSVSRSTVTETKIDTDEALLKEAFNAAESGVDYYMGTGNVVYESEGVKADVEVADVGGGAALDSGEYVIDKKAAFFWLVARDDDGNLRYDAGYFGGGSVNVCKDLGNLTNGTLKMDFYYKTGVSFKVKRWMYNFGTGSVSNVDNNLLTATTCSGGRPGLVLNLGLGGGEVPILIAVTPVGGGTKIYLEGATAFPVQGEEISSTGKAGDLEGNTGVNRRVRVVNRYDELPLFMLEAMTAAGSVY